MSQNKNPDRFKLDCDRDDNRYRSRTVQHMKNECDINIIVARAAAQGGLSVPEPVYGDVSHISQEEYLNMQNQVSLVKGEFDHLTSSERREFGSPEGYLAHKQYVHAEKLKSEALAAQTALVETKEGEALNSKENAPEEG